MKKKLKIFLVLIIIFACLIGCTSKKKKEEKVLNLLDDEVILENINYKLDKEESEYGIKYRIASNFRKTSLTNAINYFSEDINDSPYFVIRIFHYKNKSIDYAINDSTESYDKKEDVKINNIDYTKVHFINYTKADVNIYFHKHNEDVYAFVFTSGLDLSRLEDIFLKSISYE